MLPFNIGPGELLLILAIGLLVIGPGRLPDVGAALGKSLREFRKASTEMQDAVTSATKAASGTTAPVAATDGARGTGRASGHGLVRAGSRRSGEIRRDGHDAGVVGEHDARHGGHP